MRFSETKIRRTAFRAVRNILDTCTLIGQGKLDDLVELDAPEWKDKTNRTTRIDQLARQWARKELYHTFGDNVYIYGEEEKDKPLNLDHVKGRLVAFVDPIDGTDLLVRDFSNWCSAMVFAVPEGEKIDIIFSVVGHSSGDIFYANKKGAFRISRPVKGRRGEEPLYRDPGVQVELCNAGLCFYGQKPKSLLRIVQHKGFVQQMQSFASRMTKKCAADGTVEKEAEGLGIRLYDLGGNPMMVKIGTGEVDAVFSPDGAEIHDVIPGAFIAQKSGAVFTDLQGNEIDAASTLLTPQKKVAYILSGSKHLAGEIQKMLLLQ